MIQLEGYQGNDKKFFTMWNKFYKKLVYQSKMKGIPFVREEFLDNLYTFTKHYRKKIFYDYYSNFVLHLTSLLQYGLITAN